MTGILPAASPCRQGAEKRVLESRYLLAAYTRNFIPGLNVPLLLSTPIPASREHLDSRSTS